MTYAKRACMLLICGVFKHDNLLGQWVHTTEHPHVLNNHIVCVRTLYVHWKRLCDGLRVVLNFGIYFGVTFTYLMARGLILTTDFLIWVNKWRMETIFCKNWSIVKTTPLILLCDWREIAGSLNKRLQCDYILRKCKISNTNEATVNSKTLPRYRAGVIQRKWNRTGNKRGAGFNCFVSICFEVCSAPTPATITLKIFVIH